VICIENGIFNFTTDVGGYAQIGVKPTPSLVLSSRPEPKSY